MPKPYEKNKEEPKDEAPDEDADEDVDPCACEVCIAAEFSESCTRQIMAGKHLVLTDDREIEFDGLQAALDAAENAYVPPADKATRKVIEDIKKNMKKNGRRREAGKKPRPGIEWPLHPCNSEWCPCRDEFASDQAFLDLCNEGDSRQKCIDSLRAADKLELDKILPFLEALAVRRLEFCDGSKLEDRLVPSIVDSYSLSDQSGALFEGETEGAVVLREITPQFCKYLRQADAPMVINIVFDNDGSEVFMEKLSDSTKSLEVVRTTGVTHGSFTADLGQRVRIEFALDLPHQTGRKRVIPEDINSIIHMENGIVVTRTQKEALRSDLTVSYPLRMVCALGAPSAEPEPEASASELRSSAPRAPIADDILTEHRLRVLLREAVIRRLPITLAASLLCDPPPPSAALPVAPVRDLFGDPALYEEGGLMCLD